MIEASCSCSMQVDNKAAVAFLMRYLSLAHSSSFIADLKKVDADFIRELICVPYDKFLVSILSVILFFTTPAMLYLELMPCASQLNDHVT